MYSLLVLSSADVATLIPRIPLSTLLTSTAQTMHTISSASTPSRESHAGTKSGEAGPAVRGIQNPVRISTESAMHRYLYMPSRLTTNEVASTAIKVVAVPKPSGPPGPLSHSLVEQELRTNLGLPGSTLLFDEATGRCRAIVNAGELTGLRTAAASTLATKLLARKDSTRMVVFGSGVQAYYHASLILELLPSILSLALIVRSDTPRAQTLHARLKKENPKVEIDYRIAGTSSAVDAVRGSDVICCCTPSREPVFEVCDLKSGVHINAIGSYTPEMLEFPPSLLLAHIPTILVDSRTACLAEAGEIIASKIPSSHLIELGELVDSAGETTGEYGRLDGTGVGGETVPGNLGWRSRLRAEGKGEMSLFKCVGVGGMDVAITELIVKEALAQGLGTRVPY